MTTGSRRRVQFSAPNEAEVITEDAPVPGPNEVRVQTLCSAISPGTERLVYQGQVPSELDADVSIEALKDDSLSYPLSYGYACVGEVDALGEAVDENWMNESVFAFQPHTSHFVASPQALIRLPASVDPAGASMIPSMETAVNLVMDGQPMIGETALVFGQGVVGLLTTHLLAEHPMGRLVAVEPDSSRRARSETAGATTTVASADDLGATMKESADLTYELTGRPTVLNDAVEHTGYSGRVIVGSWYGTKTAPIELGAHFHRSHMQLISSQVSTIAPSHRGRWTKERRMSVVLDLLEDVQPGRLISDRFPIEEAPSVYERLANSDAPMLQPVFTYE